MIGFLSVFLVGERVVEPSILYTMQNIYKCTTILLLRDRVLFYVVNDYSTCNKMIMYLMFQYDFFYLLEWVGCISLLRKITMQCHLYLQNNWTVINMMSSIKLVGGWPWWGDALPNLAVTSLTSQLYQRTASSVFSQLLTRN